MVMGASRVRGEQFEEGAGERMSSSSSWVGTPEVRRPPDGDEEGPVPGTGLCLSGGGYRAMLFHVGSLWRLNQAGFLPKLNRVSSVSGGSITAGFSP